MDYDDPEAIEERIRMDTYLEAANIARYMGSDYVADALMGKATAAGDRLVKLLLPNYWVEREARKQQRAEVEAQ